LEEVTVPPEIGPPTLNAALNEAEEIEISFETQPGVNYEVLYRNHFNESSWTPIETILGDGTTKSVSYPTLNPAFRLYAVQAE
jgi:hypothetical protein